MTTPNFSVAHAKTLKIRDAIDYIEEYFIPLDNGKHAFKYEGKWVVKEFYEIQTIYFNRLPASVNDYYFKEYDRILTPVWDKTKPQFYDNFINFDFIPIVLRTHYWFIVDEFINKHQGLNVKPKELHTQYDNYYNKNLRDDGENPLTKTEFIEALKTVGIKTVKCSTNVYKYEYEELFEIGLKNEWFFEDPKDAEITRLKNDLWALKEMKDAEIKALRDEVETLRQSLADGYNSEEEEELIYVDAVDMATDTDDLENIVHKLDSKAVKFEDEDEETIEHITEDLWE